jgi:hypothetical protein
MLEINEKTRQLLANIENQVGKLNAQYQTVINTYVAANNKDGAYRVSSDGKRLIRTE